MGWAVPPVTGPNGQSIGKTQVWVPTLDEILTTLVMSGDRCTQTLCHMGMLMAAGAVVDLPPNFEATDREGNPLE